MIIFQKGEYLLYIYTYSKQKYITLLMIFPTHQNVLDVAEGSEYKCRHPKLQPKSSGNYVYKKVKRKTQVRNLKKTN